MASDNRPNALAVQLGVTLAHSGRARKMAVSRIAASAQAKLVCPPSMTNTM